MTDPWLHILGLFAAFLGFTTLEDARKGRRLRSLTFFWSGLAGYLFVSNNLTPSFDRLDAETVAGFGLLFCAVSPVIGWLWWGEHGRIRRRLLRLVIFVVLLTVALVVWTLILGPVAETWLLAALTAGLPFLPIRKTWRRWRLNWAHRRQRRQEQAAARRQQVGIERDVERERAELERLRQRETHLTREVAARDHQLAKLTRKEEQLRQSLERRRQEVVDQVRMLRQAEVERIRQGDAGLRFHPHYGFLMAEAWRALRAQIARGERIPAVENDAFFNQVVEELVARDDFEERYFHRSGRRAIAAVNAYLEGRQSLDTTQQELKLLRLKPDKLAPEQLSEYNGASLLAAWLVPHRRFQALRWEDFQDGRHFLQEQILTFLRLGERALPDRREWQRLWDAHPSIFTTAGSAVPQSTTGEASTLWRAVSSIWHSVRDR